jgi:hypothetical protein
MSLSAPWKAVHAGGVLGPLREAAEALDLARGVRHDGACSHRPKAPSHHRLMFVPGGPDRHPIEGEDALRPFLLTDLEIPPGVTETAMTELDNSGRYTIQDILISDKNRHFWRLDTPPKPTSLEPSVTSAIPPKLPKRSRVQRYHSPNPNQRGRRSRRAVRADERLTMESKVPEKLTSRSPDGLAALSQLLMQLGRRFRYPVR